MIASITTGVSTAIGFVGDVVTAIFGESGELAAVLPAVGLAIGVSLVGWGIGKVKSLIKGY